MKIEKLKNEKLNSKLFEGSPFFYVPYTGDLAVPEILLGHFMKTVFFGSANKKGPDCYLNPDLGFDENERFLIGAFRGRKKQQNSVSYYSPAYPVLAKNLNVKSSKGNWSSILFSLLNNGFKLSNDINEESEITPDNFSKVFIDALMGDLNKSHNGDVFSKLVSDSHDIEEIRKKGMQTLKDKIKKETDENQGLKDVKKTEFEKAVVYAFYDLCTLEEKLARPHWISCFSALLRIIIPISAVNNAMNFIQLRNWILRSLDGIEIDKMEIECFFSESNKIFKPSSRPNKDLDVIVDEYFWALNDFKNLIFIAKKIESDLDSDTDLKKIIDEKARLTLKLDSYQNQINIYDFLSVFRRHRDSFAEKINQEVSSSNATDSTISKKIRRLSKRRESRKNYKSFVEFLQVLKKSQKMEENASHIIEPIKIKNNNGLGITKPGVLIIQLFVYLAAEFYKRKKTKKPLTLKDFEDYLRIFGIDYSAYADGRELLLDTLDRAGLIISTPDAGDHLRIENPYK